MLFDDMGRINRFKYIKYSLFNLLIFVFILLISLRVDSLFFLFPVEYIIHSLLRVRLIVLRLHDLDKPGNHFFLLLVPFYNIYIAFILLFKKGTDGPNQHGEDPLSVIEVT